MLEGLEAVRESGQTDMLDYEAVRTITASMGYPETMLWIDEHRREYTEGIFRGFVAAK